MVFTTILMFTYTTTSQTSITIPIIAGEDDAEEVKVVLDGERVLGEVDIFSSDLELGSEDNGQYVGMIFRDVQIPAGATITNAYIQFQCDDNNDEVITLTIYGAKEANQSAAFTETLFDISRHPGTTATVSWTPAPWTPEMLEAEGPEQQTPDLSTIIAEIISLHGWTLGNNIMIVVTSDATEAKQHREATSFDDTFDDDMYPPTLNVTYILTDFAQNEKVCQGEVIPPLTAIGDSIIWYSEPDFTGFLHTGNIFQTGKSEPGCFTFYITSTFDDNTVLKDTASLIISEGNKPITPETSDDTIYCPGDQMAYITASPLSGGLVSWYYDPVLSILLATGVQYNPSGITSTTTYYVTETVGDCESPPSEVTVEIRKTSPYENEKICIVTVDLNTGKNIIIWEKTPDQGIASYNVYRETNITDIFDPIGILSSVNPGFFIDNDSDPAKQSYKYKITTVDSCSNESALSAPHATMHLTLNDGLNGGTNLIWSKYYGFDVQTYNIWRGSSADNMFLIGSVSGSNFTYTDQYPLAGTNIYQVEVVSPFSCNINNLKATYSSSFSNIAYRYAVSIGEFSSYKFRIFPNPTSNITTIEFSNPEREQYQLILTDLTGKVLKSMDKITDEKIEINRDGLSDGLYLIELKGPKTYWSKILIE